MLSYNSCLYMNNIDYYSVGLKYSTYLELLFYEDKLLWVNNSSPKWFEYSSIIVPHLEILG